MPPLSRTSAAAVRSASLALEHQRAEDGAPHRARDLARTDLRSGVQERARVHSDDLARGSYPDCGCGGGIENRPTIPYCHAKTPSKWCYDFFGYLCERATDRTFAVTHFGGSRARSCAADIATRTALVFQRYRQTADLDASGRPGGVDGRYHYK